MSTESRYFKVCKLNNMKVEIGRAKIPKESSNMLSASKKLFKTICREKNILKNKKFYESTFYIQETTTGSKKKVYGPYKGTCKVGNDGKKCIFNVIKLRSSKKIKKGGGGDNNSNNQKLLKMISNEKRNVEELIKEINNFVEIDDIRDNRGRTLLIIECTKGEPNIKIMEALINKGANVNYKYGKSKSLSKQLLGLRTNYQGINKYHGLFEITPLMELLEFYNYKKNDVRNDVLLFLLKNGADINYINNYGFTPLTYYLSNLYRYSYKEIIYETVNLLLENGASNTINVVNRQNKTALYYAVKMGDNTNHNKKDGVKNLIKLLLKHGATELYEKNNDMNIKKFSVLNNSLNKNIKKFVRKQRPSFLSRFSSMFSVSKSK
jgi:ankyrin repeat protein